MAHLRFSGVCALVLALTACEGRVGGAAGGAKADAEPDDLAPVGTLPSGVERSVAEEGRELYRKTCIVCHGEQGGGTLLGPSLTDGQWLGGRTGTLDEIAALVRDGAAASDSFPVPMHPRGDGTLTDGQLRAVAAYTYSIARREPATP